MCFFRTFCYLEKACNLRVKLVKLKESPHSVHFLTNLVEFTEEIRHGKLDFSVQWK